MELDDPNLGYVSMPDIVSDLTVVPFVGVLRDIYRALRLSGLALC